MTILSTLLAAAAAPALLAPSPVAAPGPLLDEGMWTFDNPPVEAIAKAYGVQLDAEWLEHVQKSCVRVSTGGSGSIVSPRGLVMTNHHVASDILQELSTAERDLLSDGFHARSIDEEIACPDVHVDVLWTIRDVTAEVEKAANGLSTAEAGAARREAMTAIEDRAKAETGLHTEVVTLYQGGRYHLYSYKRFEDIRLVFAPEKSIAFFGGDADNFEYPRYCLDVTFLRIYEDGQPLEPDHYLTWSQDGADDGELTFVAGHPGRTQRLNTVAHLEYLRDYQVPSSMTSLMRQETLLRIFSQESPENARIAENDLFGVQNSRKVYVGRLSGLLDPAVFEAKRAEESRLRAAVAEKPAWQERWGSAWDEVAAAQAALIEFRDRLNAVGGGNMALGVRTHSYAVSLVRMAAEMKKPSAERLRGYGDAALPGLRAAIAADVPIYEDYEIFRLEWALSNMAEQLGGDDPAVVTALAGKSPRARAEELVRGTMLGDLEARRALLDGGPVAIDESDDPMLEFARSMDPIARRLLQRLEDDVQSVEAAAYAKIAAARFAVLGDSVYPDATFTLRLSYGEVAGYRETSGTVPPFTTFGGAFAKARERAGEEWYTLPASWKSSASDIDPTTPFNLVTTHDIIGGNSGSPVIDAKGHVVGLIFDGNIHSLIGNFAYSDDVARSVSVDSRGIVEALREVYGAARIVSELGLAD